MPLIAAMLVLTETATETYVVHVETAAASLGNYVIVHSCPSLMFWGWGLRENGRLVASVRVRLTGAAAELGRLVVAPDRQGHGLGSWLLRRIEAELSDSVRVLRLFTGEHSLTNQRLYT